MSPARKSAIVQIALSNSTELTDWLCVVTTTALACGMGLSAAESGDVVTFAACLAVSVAACVNVVTAIVGCRRRQAEREALLNSWIEREHQRD